MALVYPITTISDANGNRGPAGLMSAQNDIINDINIVALAFLVQTLTDGASIAWNLNSGWLAKVTLGGNRTLAAPTNIVAGVRVAVQITQDGTGSRTLTWNAVFKFAGGTAPTLSTGAGKIDVFHFVSFDGTTLVPAGLDVR